MGETIVTGSRDNIISLWNLQGEKLDELQGHKSSVNAVAISSDGKTIVSGSGDAIDSKDNSVRLWDRQGKEIAILGTHEDSIYAVAISPDGETIVSGDNNGAVLWNRQGEKIGQLHGHQGSVKVLAISPDSETIVSGSSNGTIYLWKRNGEFIGELKGHQDSVNAIAFRSDGHTIVSGSDDNTVRLWNFQSLKKKINTKIVIAVAITPDIQSIIPFVYRHFSGNWFLLPEREIVVVGEHENWVNEIAISANGQTIVSGSEDGTMRLWNRQGEPIRRTVARPSVVRSTP
jgi:WD40 repeat protein